MKGVRVRKVLTKEMTFKLKSKIQAGIILVNWLGKKILYRRRGIFIDAQWGEGRGYLSTPKEARISKVH